MACERYRDALTDVAAGEPATAAVEAHLASCEACRAELLALRRTLAVADAEMAELASADPSPGLSARIRQAAAQPSSEWRLGWLWPAVAAAATLLVALAMVLGRGTGPTPEPRVAVDAAHSQPTGEAPVAQPLDEDAAPADEQAFAGAFQEKEPTPQIVAQRGPRFTRVGTRDDRPPEPEVLVPPGETEALLRFAAGVRPRVVSSDSLLVADMSGPLTEPKGVEIQPLVVVPLDPAEPSGTD
ncbi:MAG TPA: hypothetical protein VE359_04685 [Vicinamibacteria bacterium]|nr:hypothetical protein [Vicinamibacteria bacterium]